jgi:hypothetical protein
MFYLLKHILLFILVIFKLKYNNLIFNEIIILNASYVCLHAFSLHRESSDLDLGRRPLIFKVVLSHRHARCSKLTSVPCPSCCHSMSLVLLPCGAPCTWPLPLLLLPNPSSPFLSPTRPFQPPPTRFLRLCLCTTTSAAHRTNLGLHLTPHCWNNNFLLLSSFSRCRNENQKLSKLR